MGAPYPSLDGLIRSRIKDSQAPYYIADVLREAIYRGLLSDGEALHQSQLAEQLKVSPIPLREALRLLETEGLVAFKGWKGAMVTSLSAAEVREIYEMVGALETSVLRIALPHIGERDIAVAGEALARMDEEKDCVVWREQNTLFHNTLYEAADRPVTLAQIARLRQRVDRYIRIHIASMRDESQAQHRAILEAVGARDADAAIAALACHIESTSNALQRHMRSAGGAVGDEARACP